MADMYTNVDKLIDDAPEDSEEVETIDPDPVYVWVVRRKGIDGKFVTKYESTGVERTLEFYVTELRYELMGDPAYKTENIDRLLNQYRHDFPGWDKDEISGVTNTRDRKYWLKYLQGLTMRKHGWRSVQVQRPAIKHDCHSGVVWRVYRAQRETAPEHESFDRRIEALKKLDNILGDKG